MITNRMKLYDYYEYLPANEYGQAVLSTKVAGQVRMSINLTTQQVQQNVNYSKAQYVGLTFDNINDNCCVKFGERLLKVMYVNSFGRYNQVFMYEDK